MRVLLQAQENWFFRRVASGCVVFLRGVRLGCSLWQPRFRWFFEVMMGGVRVLWLRRFRCVLRWSAVDELACVYAGLVLPYPFDDSFQFCTHRREQGCVDTEPCGEG